MRIEFCWRCLERIERSLNHYFNGMRIELGKTLSVSNLLGLNPYSNGMRIEHVFSEAQYKYD